MADEELRADEAQDAEMRQHIADDKNSRKQDDNNVAEQESVEASEHPTASESKTTTENEAEPTLGPKAVVSDHQPRLRRLKHWCGQHKIWTASVVIIVLLGVLAAVPYTRYKLAGLLWRQTATIRVFDSQTHKPITSAAVTLDGKTAHTNSSGIAYVKAHVGSHMLVVSKAYYHQNSQSVLVPIMRPKNADVVYLQATGRQVPVSVVNAITGKPVPNITIKAVSTEAITDKNGQATVVLPANQSNVAATLTGTGFNTKAAHISVTTAVVNANTLQVTPSGKIYFLSNRSGNIDVVKTDLDGNSRQTVLAGTGKEDPNNTLLLASRDWKFMALLSKRDGGDNAKLFLINTQNDAVTTMDEGNASFNPVGWAAHDFVYTVNRNGYNNWQPNATSIKSYDADSAKINSLVSTNATGSSNADAEYETTFPDAVKLINNMVVYSKTWYRYPGYLSVDGKVNTLATINADGTGANTLKTADASKFYFTNLIQSSPNEVYVTQQDPEANTNSQYFEIDGDGTIKQTQDTHYFTQSYPTYLVSPSSKQTLWAAVRDGKNTLFVGDADGQNGKVVLNATDQTIYGWFTDNYVLSAKSGSELYIMGANGGQQIKITDYYKPTYNFRGYGGGYGGI
ncbi:MAG TPA: hypothetical protein VLG16_01365 [Candidatus Saccharimonadales bacterium]|nr:hypothetical protein [Candidatus Saccharimonadales bacterium]